MSVEKEVIERKYNQVKSRLLKILGITQDYWGIYNTSIARQPLNKVRMNYTKDNVIELKTREGSKLIPRYRYETDTLFLEGVIKEFLLWLYPCSHIKVYEVCHKLKEK